MKLLVTGGLGFIGSNFILHVLNKYPKFKITNIDAEFLGSNKQNLKELQNNKNYKYIKGNHLGFFAAQEPNRNLTGSALPFTQQTGLGFSISTKDH